ncbi:MAG: 50S ribosomal protein L28 [Lachnospiraceae bacterium]|nr:50S ribosomal protein L28 [Lachnospiraceae bacterium]
MAKCAVCGKGVLFGNNVSHSHKRTNRMFKPNIRTVRCKVNGGTKTLHVCARCLRAGKVERA